MNYDFLDYTNLEVITMNKKEQEKEVQKAFHDEFDAVTNKVKVENQNQTHNARKEGINPINQRR